MKASIFVKWQPAFTNCVQNLWKKTVEFTSHMMYRNGKDCMENLLKGILSHYFNKNTFLIETYASHGHNIVDL